tara:strand:+ start:445 stop:624 length:180 start_codon:yes stop_codon:yes gene_type:complete
MIITHNGTILANDGVDITKSDIDPVDPDFKFTIDTTFIDATARANMISFEWTIGDGGPV